MKDNNQNFWYLIDRFSVLSTIFGFTIFDLLKNIYPERLQYKTIVILFIAFVITIRYQRLIIPRYLIHKEDKPEKEAGGSLVVTACIILSFSIIITLQFINLSSNRSSTSAKNLHDDLENDTVIDTDSNKEKIDSEKDNSDNILTPLEIMIEEYIIRSSEEVVPIDEWEMLSNDELYYIRNGIFAFAGQYFESGYYERFSWYVGNVSNEDIWDYITPCQLKNINNISKIEKQKDMKTGD